MVLKKRVLNYESFIQVISRNQNVGSTSEIVPIFKLDETKFFLFFGGDAENKFAH